MKSWEITKKDLRILVRDARALLVLLVLPLVFITIIGLTMGKLNGNRQLNRELRQELNAARRLSRSLRAQSAILRTDYRRASQPMLPPSNVTGRAPNRASEDRLERRVSPAVGASRRLSVAGTPPHDQRTVPSALTATPPSSAVAPARGHADDSPGHNARGQR